MLISEQNKPLQNPGNSDVERWVWDQIQTGEMVDLAIFCAQQKGLDAPENLASHEGADNRWQHAHRQISTAFIKRVLIQKLWHEALPHQGFRIKGARLVGKLNLMTARVTVQVWMDQCRFEGEVLLSDAHFEKLLSFEGSTFEAGIRADRLRVDGSLLLREGVTVRGEVQ